MEVFGIVFDKCTTVSNAIEGFKESGVFPWDPMIINNKKLAPLTMFENQRQLLDVNTSINEGHPETKDCRRQNVTDSFGSKCQRSQIKRTNGDGCDHPP